MMATMQQVVNAIYAKLSGDETLAAAASIQEGEGKLNLSLGQALHFDIVTGDVNGAFAADAFEGELQVDVYGLKARGRAALRATMDLARALLHQWRSSPTGWNDVQVWALDYGTVVEEEDTHHGTLRFTVTAS